MRQTRAKWVVGDRVRRGAQEGVIVRERSGGNVERLLVRVVSKDGALAGETAWPEGWTPQLGEGQYVRDCGDCGREFRSDDSFAIWCRTCERQHYAV